jgi:hypothetical protein
VIWYAHLVQQYLDEELANPYRLRAAGILPAIAPHNDQRLVAKVRQKPMLSFAHRLRRMLERYESSEEVKRLEARRCGLQGKKTYRSHRSFGTLVKRRYKNATPRTYIGAYGFSISDNCSSVNLTPHSCTLTLAALESIGGRERDESRLIIQALNMRHHAVDGQRSGPLIV